METDGLTTLVWRDRSCTCQRSRREYSCLDNEVYSNTGGQTSKATPASAIAKFSASGKYASKKDLGMMAMTYGNVYVAQIASGANQMQTIKALKKQKSILDLL